MGPLSTRAEAATRLGAERRRVFVVGTLLGLLVPVAPYLTGTWETIWFTLARTDLPLAVRALLFLFGFHVLLAVVLLPLSYYGGYVLPRAFGLGRQPFRSWIADWLKGTLLGAAFGTGLGGVFVWSATAFEAGWWWLFALVLSVAALTLVFAAPYVLVPIFFKMRPLADSATAERIRGLVRRAGADIRDVCSLDFSRRTAEANAAVIGLGRSRRVVLADTLLADFAPDEVDAVVAHELGHHVNRDVPRLLLGQLVMVWVGLAIAAWLAPSALPLLSLPYLGYVPGFPVLLAVAELFLLLASPLTNWWSRRLEAAADHFALRLTRNPTAFALAMRRLGDLNLIELRPPRWAELLLGSHPALARRIALAENWPTG